MLTCYKMYINIVYELRFDCYTNDKYVKDRPIHRQINYLYKLRCVSKLSYPTGSFSTPIMAYTHADTGK